MNKKLIRLATSGTLLASGALASAFSARAGDLSNDVAHTDACCAVVELRQYTLYPGKRDTFIRLFETTFVESQEAVGIHLFAQFRDVNDPNRFVWVRGFDGMNARLKALTDFYYGRVWKSHRDQANSMLYDNDNVLLLHPTSEGSGFIVGARARPAFGSRPAHNDFVVGTMYYFDHPVTEAFVAQFDTQLLPLFEKSGARVLARYASEKSKNTFERLPVRENDNVFVWFASYPNRAAYDRYLATLGANKRWSDDLFAVLNKALQRPPETLMLQATPRSIIGH